MIETRKCKKCAQVRLISEFALYDAKRGYRRHECRRCVNHRHNSYYLADKASYIERARKSYEANKSSQWTPERRKRANENAKRYTEERRDIVLGHYGRECACCGEQNELFLTIDHINNDGAKMRKEHGVSLTLYRWLIKNGFPEGFRTLCYNCNCGRARNGGVCPHEEQGRFNDYPFGEYAPSSRGRKRPAFVCDEG